MSLPAARIRIDGYRTRFARFRRWARDSRCVEIQSRRLQQLPKWENHETLEHRENQETLEHRENHENS
jgi:hypothetical protein